MNEISLPTPRGPMQAYTATPAAAGPWPGVVVIHDAFGMTKALRDQVEWMSREGFVVIAPNLFRLKGTMACMKAAMKDIAARSGPSFEDVEVARAWLAAQGGCSGKIGVIGFCMGGGYAVALAPGGKFQASSVNYGRLPDDAEAFLATACPIVGSYGGRDGGLKGVAAKLEGILTAKGIPHDVKEYPEAGHSFMEDHDRKDLPWLFVALKGVFHAGYHEASARDAQTRVVAFFNTHLRTPAG